MPQPITHEGLLFAEDVLSRIRAAVQGTALWTDSAVVSNEMLQAGTSFADMALQDSEQSKPAYALFLGKHWSRAQGEPVDSTAFYVARDAAPHCLTIRTQSRQGYLEGLPLLAEALTGMHVSLDESRSWTWDQQTRTLAGRATYRTVYVLTVHLQAKKPFSATKWLAQSAAHVPRGSDSRADRCVWQMLEDFELPRTLVEAVSPEREGLRLTCPSAKSAETVVQRLFADCVTHQTKKERGTELLVCFA